MAVDRRALLGGLARFQAVVAGMVAQGAIDVAKVPTPFAPREAEPAKPTRRQDAAESERRMAGYLKGIGHQRRQ